jgi:hypothetical protein
VRRRTMDRDDLDELGWPLLVDLVDRGIIRILGT